MCYSMRFISVLFDLYTLYSFTVTHGLIKWHGLLIHMTKNDSLISGCKLWLDMTIVPLHYFQLNEN